jgi:hypothetical protein
MAWSMLSDDFFSHPKVVRAGRDARDLFIVALCHCNEFLTDGLIEFGYLRQLAAKADIDEAKTAAAVLVREGLWHTHERGYVVHHFLDYNLSRQEHETKRQSKVEAGRKGGQRSGESRRGERPVIREPEENGLFPEQVTVSKGEANGEADALANGEADALANGEADALAKTKPYSHIPYPDSHNPIPTPLPPSPPPQSGPEVSVGDPLDGFDSFWAAYPVAEAKDAARKAWRSLAPDPELQERVLAGIERAKLSDRWQRGMIPFAGKWLTDRRWEDEFAPPLALAVSDPQSRARNGPSPTQTNFNRPRSAAEAAPPLGVSALATEAARIQARFDALQIKGQNYD